MLNGVESAEGDLYIMNDIKSEDYFVDSNFKKAE
jgi:hypothetical protein